MATALHRTPNARPPNRARSQDLLRLLGEQDHMLHTQKEALRKTLPAEMVGVIDDAERALDAEEFGVGALLLELTSQRVQGIETALRRMALGEYGACSECTSSISPARLRALPFASRCRSCQEKRDTAASSMRRHEETDQIRP